MLLEKLRIGLLLLWNKVVRGDFTEEEIIA